MKVGQAIELIRFRVSSENVEAFLKGRRQVDVFVSTLNGYVGTEILKINQEEFLILIRWENEEAVRDAQKITDKASIISDWINKTAQFITFETSLSEYKN